MKEGSKRVEEEEGRRKTGREGEERRRIVSTNNCRTGRTRRRAGICALQDLFLFLALISIK